MNRFSSLRGTVTLVALCFVTVMGITLAGYIAVCSRAMNLSNRTFHGNLSKQLAEVGIDEALRAFNKNDWSGWASNPTAITGGTTAWTLDTTNKRATRTITFNSPKFGQGVTGTVKIRVDNYDAHQLGATYGSSVTYRLNDLVSYNGTWFRSVQNSHSGNTPLSGLGYPNLAYWAPAPIPWSWSPNNNYTADYHVVNYGGTWYRCSTTHTSGTTFTAANWTSMPAPSLAITTFTSYTAGTFAYRVSTGTWYRCITSHFLGGSWDGTKWSTAAPYISWAYQASVPYSFNDVVYYNATWWRFINATPTSGITPSASNPTYWENALTGTMHGWNGSTINYSIGDVVYYSSQWYRCIRAHTSNASTNPTNTANWTNTPRYSTAWEPNRQYSQNDTVRYNGVWYLSLQNSNSAQNPATATSYWIDANTATTSYQWNATTAYTTSDYKCYGGVWYKCSAAHTGQNPNSTAYWTATWAHTHGVTTGAPVVYAEGTVTIAGSPSLRTQLRATLAPAPLFPNAAAAITTLSANSGGTVDSYDGSVISMSTGGTSNTYTYNQTTSPFSGGSPNLGYSAVVAGGSTASTAVTLSSTAVKGYVAAPSATSSPFGPLISTGGSASVKGPSSPASPNVDTARVSRSPSIPQFDPIPSGGLSAAFTAFNFPIGLALPSATTVNIGTPGATTPSRYYYLSNLTLGGGATMTTLNINGPVILFINGDLTLNGGPNGIININSTGSAEIHIADSLNVTVGSDGIKNLTLDPKKLILICDSATSSSQFYSDGGYPFYGAIYLPNTTNSSGFYNDNNNVQIYGAVSAKEITYSGANLNLHYDTSLRHATFGGVDQPYTVSQWRELPATEQATMP